jgi:hypothetical protein
VQSRLAHVEQKYKGIINVDKVIARREQDLSVLEGGIKDLRHEYAHKRKIFDALIHEISTLEGRLDFAGLGMYQQSLQFDTSAEYAIALAANKDRQKEMISASTAVACSIEWTVNGSKREGKTMSSRAIRMVLRAFNNECEVIISKVTWKNYDASRERIRKSAEAINKLNESNHIGISDQYIKLKVDELRLTYDERQRKREEQERLRDERAAAREEEKAQREIEAEIRRAMKEEGERLAALEKARAELAAATGAQLDRLNQRIMELEDLALRAHDAKERAISMAQQTRVGHVYIISNIGSFGEQVFKVGMTRRIDPMERIIELGDASVPFPFDVHALIFTQDAPSLERSLQQALEKYRVNRVNLRKEFFRVSVTEVKAILADRLPDLPFREESEAQEYFNSLPKIELEALAHEQQEERFPVAI